jgi:hypothetical protein
VEDEAVLGRLADAEQRLSEAKQSGLEQAAAARRLEAEKEELAERLAAAQLEVAGLEAQLEVARLELEEKVLKVGTKIQVGHRINILLDVTVPYIAINPSFESNR